MAKLFFSILAGYIIFLGLLTLQVMSPFIDNIDQHLNGQGQFRLSVSTDLPLPSVVLETINEHPLLILRASEGAVVVLISWSALLLLTHWVRRLRTIISIRRMQRATRVSHQLAALAARQRDGWF